MESFEVETSDSIVKNGKKRKNNIVVDKVKKKKKHTEIVEINEPTVEVIEKVKKKKKKEHENVIETKTKSDEVIEENINCTAETNKCNAKAKKKKVRELPTVTIAVPGSILDNAQSPEFRTYLAGQIARAACIYKIDEVCCIWF